MARKTNKKTTESGSTRPSPESLGDPGEGSQPLKLSEIQTYEKFRKLLADVAAEDAERLRDEILRDGFRDAVVVWKSKKILIDGHRRLEIWRIDFGADDARGPAITEMEFDDEDAAIVWAIQNQLAKRNLNKAQRMQLAMKLKPLYEEKAKENQRRKGCTKKDEVHLPVDTRQSIADAAGVSRDTVGKYQTVQEKGIPELMEAVRNEAITINTAALAAKCSPAEQAQVVTASKTSRRAASQTARHLQPSPPTKTTQTPVTITKLVMELDGRVDELYQHYAAGKLDALRQMSCEMSVLHQSSQRLTSLVKELSTNEGQTARAGFPTRVMSPYAIPLDSPSLRATT